MKTLKKSFISLFIILTILLLCSCKNSNKIRVGILQYTTINALDNAKEGIIEGLKENGFIEGENIVISVLNPEADPNSLDIMAKDLVRKSDIVIFYFTCIYSSIVCIFFNGMFKFLYNFYGSYLLCFIFKTI